MRRVVGIRRRVVPVHLGVGDEGDRSGAEGIVRIQQPARLAKVAHDVPKRLGRAGRLELLEEWGQIGEHAGEVARHDGVIAQVDAPKAHPCRDPRRAGGPEAKPQTGQERSPAVSPGPIRLPRRHEPPPPTSSAPSGAGMPPSVIGSGTTGEIAT